MGPDLRLAATVSSPSGAKETSELARELAQGLRRAARELGSEGKPEVGAAYLRQSLALLPEDAAREVLLDLAGIEKTYDMRSAAEHFGALPETGNIEVVADAASALLALYPSVRNERVWRWPDGR